MARRRTLTSTLYRAARISATGRAVRTGHTGRRAKNIVVGRALGRSGFWWCSGGSQPKSDLLKPLGAGALRRLTRRGGPGACTRRSAPSWR